MTLSRKARLAGRGGNHQSKIIVGLCANNAQQATQIDGQSVLLERQAQERADAYFQLEAEQKRMQVVAYVVSKIGLVDDSRLDALTVWLRKSFDLAGGVPSGIA